MREIFYPLLARFRIDSVLFGCLNTEGMKDLSCGDIETSFSQIDAHSTLLFPSHFFEHHSYSEILGLITKHQKAFRVQLSLGAEFIDYQQQLLSLAEQLPNLFLGVELVLDRPLNEVQQQQIKLLQNSSVNIRLLCIPQSDRSPFVFLRTILRDWGSGAAVYFPAKVSSLDSHLSNEEIFLLQKKLALENPPINFEVHSALKEYEKKNSDSSESAKNFRLAPSIEEFQASYPLLSKHPKTKRFLYSLFLLNGVRHFLVLPYGVLWLLHDPITALSMPLRFLRQPIKAFHKLKDLLIWSSYRFIEILYLIRHATILIYVFLYRALSFCNSTAIKIFHLILPILRSPAWHLEKSFPWLYKVTFFPFFKVYWFLEFQIKKRILKFPVQE